MTKDRLVPNKLELTTKLHPVCHSLVSMLCRTKYSSVQYRQADSVH